MSSRTARADASKTSILARLGTRDPLLADTRLEKALRALDVAVEARYYPDRIHAFHAMVWNSLARRCRRAALAFLDCHMRPVHSVPFVESAARP